MNYKRYIKIDGNSNVIDYCINWMNQYKADPSQWLFLEDTDNRHSSLRIQDNNNVYIFKYIDDTLVKKSEAERAIELNTSIELKIDLLRAKRDQILTSLDFAITRKIGEEDGIALSIGKQTKTLTDAEYSHHLLVMEQLRDLPTTIDIENTTYEDINNGSIFSFVTGIK
jgi:hypothetical protein